MAIDSNKLPDNSRLYGIIEMIADALAESKLREAGLIEEHRPKITIKDECGEDDGETLSIGGCL